MGEVEAFVRFGLALVGTCETLLPSPESLAPESMPDSEMERRASELRSSPLLPSAPGAASPVGDFGGGAGDGCKDITLPNLSLVNRQISC